MSTRLAFVNFKGQAAFDAVELDKDYSDTDTEDFLKQHCGTLIEGVEALVTCVKMIIIEQIVDDAEK